MDLFEGAFKNEESIKLGGTTKSTAKKAAEYLLSLDIGFKVPSRKGRKNLLIVFAESGLTLYGKAFDIVKSTAAIDFDELAEVRKNLHSITIYEIKSTNKKSVKENFERYFFSISTAELLTAQNLKEKYRFVFVNTLTNNILDMSLQDIYKNAKGIYPSWSIQF